MIASISRRSGRLSVISAHLELGPFPKWWILFCRLPDGVQQALPFLVQFSRLTRCVCSSSRSHRASMCTSLFISSLLATRLQLVKCVDYRAKRSQNVQDTATGRHTDDLTVCQCQHGDCAPSAMAYQL
jgi:hypothetical protein